MDYCDPLWSLWVSPGPSRQFLWLHPSTEEGWRGHSSPFSPLLWKIVQLSDHGSISVSTLCWIIARFLLVLCYVWCLVAGVWSWTESLRVTFVFSFIETVLQLLLAFNFFQIPSVSELVRCWPHGMFYWTPLQWNPNRKSLLCSWMTIGFWFWRWCYTFTFSRCINSLPSPI